MTRALQRTVAVEGRRRLLLCKATATQALSALQEFFKRAEVDDGYEIVQYDHWASLFCDV